MDTIASTYKVVVTGVDTLNENRKLCIIKVGNFSPDKNGIADAIDKGLLDKFGSRDIDEHVPVVVKEIKAKQGRAFKAVIQRMAHNGRTVLAVYKAFVHFKPL